MRNNGSDRTSPDNRHRTTRRGLLVATTAVPFLPATWTAPVVQSVLLPAHAQISGPPDVEECLVTDVIPRREFECSDSETCEQFSYSLEGGCLVRTEEPCTGTEPAAGALQIVWRPGTSESPGVELGVLVQVAAEPVGVGECDSGGASTTPTQFRTITISGEQYQVSFTVGRTGDDPPTFFVSDITVAPA